MVRLEDAIAARLLRDARWMTGLTQAEVAQRAGVTRQVIGSYERGRRSPSVATLDRMLAGCGLRLRLSMVPEAGLEDVPTRALLALPPPQRIDLPVLDALEDIAGSVGDHRTMLVSGKAAARLHGACVRVDELELWFSREQPVAEIRSWMAGAGVSERFPLTAADLREGVTLTHGPDGCTDVRLRSEPQFEGFLRRSTVLGLGRTEPTFASLVEAGDCAAGWHPRDRDHLAVQRAIRLAGELPK
jgi:transcriptional regulator with XRE-family HTH domain